MKYVYSDNLVEIEIDVGEVQHPPQQDQRSAKQIFRQEVQK